VAKTLYFSSKNTMNCYKSFCSVSKFWSPTQLFFFPSWNIDFIIPLVSITYLALIHNYNTIKYIYFISPRQRAGMHLVILRKYKSCDFSYFIHYYYLLSYILRCTVIVWFFIIFNLVFNFLFCTIKLFWAKICWESWIKK
jgi:hypothetical protein